MAFGDISSQLDTEVLNLAQAPNVNPGASIYRVAAGIYILFYNGSDSMQYAATFAINETTGAVTATPIDEYLIGSTVGAENNTRAQVTSTCYLTTGSVSGGNLEIVTITCDTDGTNIAEADSDTAAHGGTVSGGKYLALDPNVFMVLAYGTSSDMSTYLISDTGTIASTPIQGQSSMFGLSSTTAVAWLSDIDTMVVALPNNSDLMTYNVAGNGTFSSSIVDDHALTGFTSDDHPSQLTAVDGLIVASIKNPTVGINNENKIYIFSVDASRVITEDAQPFTGTQLDALMDRPLTTALNEPGYMWLEEGTGDIHTTGTDGVDLDSGAVFGSATKDGVLVIMSEDASAMVHVTATNELSITTFLLQSGAASSPVAFPTIAEGDFIRGSLEVDNYTPRFGGTLINLGLDIKIQRWQESIDTRATILQTAQFEAAALSLNIVNMVIDLKGVIYGTHTVHPLATDVNHEADFIDLEEASILWNKDTPVTRARLKLPLVSGLRSYEGVITRLVLIDNPGSTKQDFMLTFTVAWSPTAPALREWN